MNIFMEQFNTQELIIFLLIIAWTLAWKGVALWKSARNSQKKWFIALLVLNTLGLLEILYIFVFAKKSDSSQKNNQDF